MDIAKLVELAFSLGPGAGLGLSMGLLLFIGGLVGKRWVMIDRFNDMKTVADKSDRDKQAAEKDRDAMRYERDQTRLMLVSALGQTRKNAQLATAVMRNIQHVEVEQGDADDGPRTANLATG